MGKRWEILYIVLGSILVIIISLCVFEYNKTRVVDCEKLDKQSNMLPKQCKGDK